MKSHLFNLTSFGWALFLGCSWTWCIGMFMPVLLARDLGLWGWITFTAPNVIGAAAMGWVLARPALSERIVAEHRGACLGFSAVTIAFHVFFVLWFVPRLVGLPAAASAFAAAAVYLLISAKRPGLDLPAAAITWLISLAMMVLFIRRTGPIELPLRGLLSSSNAWFLAPACVIGFLFCPYLDLTFHRARQATSPAEARVAFGAGFGIVFLAMLVFTLLYAGRLIPLANPMWARPVFGTLIATHMIAQAAFTLCAHARSFTAASVKGGWLAALAVLSQLAMFLALAGNVMPSYHGRDAGEIIYWLFLAFYGVVFPGYVWTCMVPGRDGRSGVTRGRLRAMLIAIMIATPMYWMGFIEDRMIWFIPGAAVIVLSRFMATSGADHAAELAATRVSSDSGGAGSIS